MKHTHKLGSERGHKWRQFAVKSLKGVFREHPYFQLWMGPSLDFFIL